MTKLTGTLALIGPTLVACGDNPGQPATRRDATEFVSAPRQIGSNVELVPTIAFTSTRDNTEAIPPFNGGEIYLIDSDGLNPRRLTNNSDGDGFAALSPDGKQIVFDSNRRRLASEPVNTSDLFLMHTDGAEQTFLTRGSSATWSPDAKSIAFHRSASGTGMPIKTDPGAATFDSDIFVANVEDLGRGVPPRNLTNSPDKIDDDADWSPDGRKIVFTRHDVSDDQMNSVTAEIYVITVDGTGLTRLTFNNEEERGPSWSPDGTRIVYSCRKATGVVPAPPALPDFEICIMNADGSNQVQLTDNAVGDLTATFSPDGQRILFHRTPVNQLWTINPDGSGLTQLTTSTGRNLLANWGVLRVHVKEK
jgi:Tol biopolymer transport system component